MNALVRSTLVLVVMTLLVATTSGQTLPVLNNMDDGVYVWYKSEHLPRRDWQRTFVTKQGQLPINLNGPDRIQIVVEDLQRRRYSAGLLPLNDMLAKNPNMVLDLGGIIEAMTREQSYWCPRERRWRKRRWTENVRVATTFSFIANGQSVLYLEAKRSE